LTRPQMWSYNPGMTAKDYEYVGVKIPSDVRAKVKAIAEAEKRGFGRQALVLIELGLKEYERMESIRSGGSQIDIAVLNRQQV
jgi:hypothetical protein